LLQLHGQDEVLNLFLHLWGRSFLGKIGLIFRTIKITYQCFNLLKIYRIGLSIGFGSYTAYLSGSSASNFLTLSTASAERARIDASGRLLVGTSSARSNFFNTSIYAPQFQIEGTGDNGQTMLSITASSSSGLAGYLNFARQKSGTIGGNTIVSNADQLGYVTFQGSDGTDFVPAAWIVAEVDGTPGANDMPGRLIFATTADGASNPTERMRIASSGFVKFTDDGTPLDPTSSYHTLKTSLNSIGLVAYASNASYASRILQIESARAANSAYSFLYCYSGSADLEFNLRGDGQAYADGSWNGGGADYAEYFEWSDGNPSEEDRRGISVVLDGDKIRPAIAGEDPIGVISGNPSVVGDAAWNKWNGKYLRDDFGTYIQEDYEVEDENGNTVVQQRRQLNPAYDPDQEYTSREGRPEWDCVGLMGKLRIRKGQPTGSRWIKMRDISDSVEEWLVR
jgi:hypothetical protein